MPYDPWHSLYVPLWGRNVTGRKSAIFFHPHPLFKSPGVIYGILFKSPGVIHGILFKSPGVIYGILFKSPGVIYGILFKSPGVIHGILFKSPRGFVIPGVLFTPP